MGRLGDVLAFVNQVMAARSQRGPYRFLVRDWRHISDIDLAAKLLATDYFMPQMKPIALPVEKMSSILVLAPHQDDEAIGAGGTLLLAARAGVRVSVLYVTDGAQTNKPNIGATPSDVAKVRDQEAEQACALLGASMYRLGLSNIALSPSMKHLDQIGSIIDEVAPDIILAPWILDSPPKHRFVNHLLWLLLVRDGISRPEIWGYQVHNSLFPNGYVNYTDVATEKRQLIQCFTSQNENSCRYDHLALGMGAWNSRYGRSATPMYWELFFTLPAEEFVDLVGRFYFQDARATYRGEQDILQGIASLHRAVMGRRRNRLTWRLKRGRKACGELAG